MPTVKAPRLIYRIEHRFTQNGMWYNKDGTYNGVIKELTEGKSKRAPMDKRQRCPLEGKWHSGVKELEQLLDWFTPQDIKELYELGYGVFRFICSEYYEKPNEIYFTQRGVISREEI